MGSDPDGKAGSQTRGVKYKKVPSRRKSFNFTQFFFIVLSLSALGIDTGAVFLGRDGKWVAPPSDTSQLASADRRWRESEPENQAADKAGSGLRIYWKR